MVDSRSAGVEKLKEVHLSGSDIALEDVQRALQGSDEWWTVIFEQAGLAMLVGSVDGQVVAVSPSFEKMFGYSANEIRTTGGIIAMTHPDDIQKDLDLFGELVSGEREHYQLTKRYYRKDGSLMWGRLTVLLLRDASGEPRFVVGLTQDITESVTAEKLAQELRAASLRREQALELNDNIVQGLVVVKMALEGGFDDKAKETLTRTLEKARSIVSELLGDLEASEPGALTRENPTQI
jgi:PAS domain S-box-containing protein